MSGKLFGQIVMLILIAVTAYFAAVQVLNWQADRAYERRAQEARTAAREEAKAIERASVAVDDLEARALGSDTNENMIDGQVVHRLGENWVNDQGQIVRAAE